MTQHVAIMPGGRVFAGAPIATRHLRLVFQEPPRSNLIAALLGAPFVVDELIEKSLPVLIVQMIDFDQVDIVADDIILWIQPESSPK